MNTLKIAITLKVETVLKLDRLVRSHVFPSRSKAIQQAVEEMLTRLDGRRFAAECAKLNPAFERELADEGLATDLGDWSDDEHSAKSRTNARN